jgi:GAF domain-containing protein
MAAQKAAPQADFDSAASGYRALQRVTVAVRSHVDLRRVLDGLVADAGRFLDLGLCALARWDDMGDCLHVSHEHRREGSDPRAPSLMGMRFRPWHEEGAAAIHRLLFTEHRALVIPARGPGSHDQDPAALPAFLSACEGMALAVAPLVAGQRVQGLLVAARSRELAPWSESDVEFLRASADLAAVALQHAALRSRLAVLSASPSEIHPRLDPEALLRRLVESAMTLTRATAGMAGLREGAGMVCRERWRAGEWEPLELRILPDQGLAGWCWANRVPCVANEADQDPRADFDLTRLLGVSSALAVPILDRDGDVTGFLELHNKAAGIPFGEEDIALACSLAHHAALALELRRR